MAADFETIKDYLVGIGFSVNQQQLRKFTSALEDVGKKVERHSVGMGSKFAKAGGVMVATITSVVGATALLMDKVAKADMGYQLYGLRMLMATDTAKKFKIAIDTLGYSMEEIAFNPELNRRFNILIQDQIRLQEQLPKNFKQSMFNIREMGFQFDRLKVKLLYFFDGLSGRLEKVLGLDKANLTLEGLNDWFEKKMPIWEDNIASFVKKFKDELSDLKKVMVDIGLDKQADQLSESFKKIKKHAHEEGLMPKWGKFMLNNILGSAKMFGIVGGSVVDTFDVYGNIIKGDKEGAKEAQKKRWENIKNGFKGYSNLPSWSEINKEVNQQTSMEQIKVAAMRAGKKLKVSPEIIFNQWMMETGGFTDYKVKDFHNLAGVRHKKGDKYIFNKYSSFEDFGEKWTDMMMKNFPGVSESKTAEEFSNKLQKGRIGSYFGEESSGSYSSKMNAYKDRSSQLYNSITIGDIYVDVAQTEAKPEEIANAVMTDIQKQLNVQSLYRQNEFAGVYR